MDDSKICRGILWVCLWMFMLAMLTKALWINTEMHCWIQISSLCLLVVCLKQASWSWVVSIGGHSAFGSWVAKLRLPSSVSVHKWGSAVLVCMFRRGRPTAKRSNERQYRLPWEDTCFVMDASERMCCMCLNWALCLKLLNLSSEKSLRNHAAQREQTALQCDNQRNLPS